MLPLEGITVVSLEQAVERHFEKTKRPDCRGTGARALGLGNVEVTYDCTPKPAVPKPAAAR